MTVQEDDFNQADTKTDQPDVSVIIAAWSAEAFIHHAIASTLDQTGIDLEVVIVDDCSPDDTAGAAQRAANGDPRVRVIRAQQNGGPSAARNIALAAARGRWAAVLDSDDSFSQGRLARMVSAGDETHADIVVDNFVRVDATGRSIDNEPFLTALRYATRHEIDLADYVQNNVFMSGEPTLGYLKPLFRIDTLRRFGLEYDVALRNSEDYYLVADLLAKGAKMIFEPVEGYLYRVDAGSISHRLRPSLTRALVDAETAFHQRHADQIQGSLGKILSGRLSRLGHVHSYIELIEKLKAKNVLGAIMTVLGRPQAIGFIIIQLWNAFKDKRARAAD